MNTSDKGRQNKPVCDVKQNNRRSFLGALVGLAAGSVATVGTLSQKNGPVELPLHEAEFYKPHNLAG
jgi:hypothetical protein